MNAREKRWLKAVAQHPCIVTGLTHIQVHHVVGRTAKHNKVPIGHIWLLPLYHELHDVHGNHPCNVTHYPKKFEQKYGSQKDLFVKLANNIALLYPQYGLSFEDLPTEIEIEAILDYHK